MTDRQKTYALGAAGVLVVVGLIGWGMRNREERPGTDQAPIRIGVMAALSGPLGSLGQSALHGLELAIDETNAQGGVRGRRLELVVEDTTGDAVEGINVFNKLVDVEGVKIIAQLFVARVEVPLVSVAKQRDVFFLAHSFHPAIAHNTPRIWRIQQI